MGKSKETRLIRVESISMKITGKKTGWEGWSQITGMWNRGKKSFQLFWKKPLKTVEKGF